MITFKGNRQILKSAQILESNTRNLYPHLSLSRIKQMIGYETEREPIFFSKMKKDFSSARKIIRDSQDTYEAVVNNLQYAKVGNCTEDAIFTELLGRINCQRNIYTGLLGLNTDNKSGLLNHVVAFITDKPVKPGKEQFFKNKEAVIIDPWLGVTDFAGSYFTKLKTIFRKTFMYSKNKRFVTFSNDKIIMEILKSMSKTTSEFKLNKKTYCPSTVISITPVDDNSFSDERIAYYREAFPELILKNFKTIILSGKKKKSPQKGKTA